MSFRLLGLQNCSRKEIPTERNSLGLLHLSGCIQSSCHEDIETLGKALMIKVPGCFEGDKPTLCDRISTTLLPRLSYLSLIGYFF